MPSKHQTKLACLISVVAALLWIFLTGDQTVSTVAAFSQGPPDGYTGAPGELTCAVSGCHGGEPNTGPGQLSIIAPTVYEPGNTYEIMVEHTTTDTSRRRWGFQLTVLDGTNNRAGQLSNLSGLTQTLDGGPGGNRQYIEHGFMQNFTGQNFQVTWTFNWTAPSTDVGTVTFYASGNQANNDGNNTGDQIYTTSVTSLTGLPEIESAEVKGKKLIIMGRNFADGASLFIDGVRIKKSSNDAENPSTIFRAKKAGRDIAPGQTVVLQIVNGEDAESNLFSFTRPLE